MLSWVKCLNNIGLHVVFASLKACPTIMYVEVMSEARAEKQKGRSPSSNPTQYHVQNRRMFSSVMRDG